MVALLLLAIVPAGAEYVEDFTVAPINWNHSYPHIDGDTVVWTDFTNAHDAGMYGIYLDGGSVFTVMDTYGSNESSGVVSGPLVVWEKGTPPQSFDIYGKNLFTGVSFAIANTGKAEMDPDISGSLVVCEVLDSTYNIYAFDLSHFPYVPIGVCTEGTTHQLNPAVDGNLVVWEDYRNGNADIYGSYVTNGVPSPNFVICNAASAQNYPAVYGDTVVWVDSRNGDSDIYGYNIVTGREFAIAVGPGTQTNPAIYGDYVVYESNESGYLDIYGCDLRNGENFAITQDATIQGKPDIYEHTVIWYDLSPQRYINGAIIHNNSGSVATSARPLVSVHLAKAHVQWVALMGQLPSELTEGQIAELDAIQALMEQAVSIANPIHAAGLLQQAQERMASIL
jgi:beta propeller repeat protein